MCRGMLRTPSILDLISDVSKGEESANGRQMRQSPRGKSSSMVVTVGEGGGAQRRRERRRHARLAWCVRRAACVQLGTNPSQISSRRLAFLLARFRRPEIAHPSCYTPLES